jgi:hypothetical protein
MLTECFLNLKAKSKTYVTLPDRTKNTTPLKAHKSVKSICRLVLKKRNDKVWFQF